MVIHEWFCADHGEFEGTHAICPAFGCDSHDVVKEIRTPRGVKSDATKNFDAGIRRTADAYRQSDFASAHREGDSSKADSQHAKVLWGDEGSKMLGKPLTQAGGATSFNIKNQETGAQETWTDRGGVPTVANESTLLNKVTPKAVETTFSSREKEMRIKVTAK